MNRALRCMNNLQILKLSADNDAMDEVTSLHAAAERFGIMFNGVVLPHLTHAYLDVPMSQEVVEFVHRHQDHLLVLSLDTLGEGRGNNSLLERDMHLSSLLAVHATSDIISIVVSSWLFPRVERISINRFDNSSDYVGVLNTVTTLDSSQDARLALDLYRKGWNVELIEAVSSRVEWITEVNFVCLGGTDDLEPINMEVVLDARRCLARFFNLRSFQWYNDLEYDPPEFFSMDKAYEIVAIFGETCPSLQYCQIPYSPLWRKIKDIWIPCEEMESEIFLDDTRPCEWMLEQLAANSFPKCKELVAYIEGATEKLPEAKEVIRRFRTRPVEPLGNDKRRRAAEHLMRLGEKAGIWSFNCWLEECNYSDDE
ncbi:hypothetical protein VNI00_015832 [Paramarasmius palmivorus]|uniref:Uncharacterized protein n=1 Tax=Paramarasmius palmivorus TaxID=297713 RepID=A0AAW0BIF5_9AGAR